jgi:ABC-type dipeptide/oligopeptide/nickel transport system ATPase component
MYFNLWYTPKFFLFLIFITAKLTNMLIVGIAGGTGSGKSTVVKKIMEVFPDNEVGIILNAAGRYIKCLKGITIL